MTQNNLILTRKSLKPILFDVFFNKTKKPKPLVIFCHGYKGFKDWGAWNLVAEAFQAADLFFVKFNFSHNGGTIDQPIDFPDLDAFAENNYSKELDDLASIIDYFVSKDYAFHEEIDSSNIKLIGHSRAGGITTIMASEDSRVTSLITWASVCDFGKRSSTTGDLEQWKRDGVKYVLNGRTKQQMPHNYQFYEDYMAHKERLSIQTAAKAIIIPHLIIHAIDDPSVAFSESEAIHQWNPNSILLPIANGNHVFGAHHPWTEASLPKALKKVVKASIRFIK